MVGEWTTPPRGHGRPKYVFSGSTLVRNANGLADRIFYQALTRFEHVRIYANTVHDRTVPYVTAAIELEDTFAYHDKNGIHMYATPSYGGIGS